jgi:hypothetical protein
MDKHLQHVSHETRRAACELTLEHIKTGRRIVLPYGKVAFASLYDEIDKKRVDHDGPGLYTLRSRGERKAPDFMLERKLKRPVPGDDGGMYSWITDRSVRFANIGQARNFVKASPPGVYRVVVRNATGAYVVDRH